MAFTVEKLVEKLFSGSSRQVAAVVISTLAGGMVGSMALPLVAQAQMPSVQAPSARPPSARPPSAQPPNTQTPSVQPLEVKPADAQPPAEAPDATRTVQQTDSSIGLAPGQALMNEAASAITQQNYSLASEKLVSARKALNDVSTYYQNLAGVFLGVDSRVNTDLRDLALNSAQVRDQATYQLAVVYRAQGNPELAIPLLVEVVQSQQPTRELGQQAYQQLYELGFVGVAYKAPGQ